MYRFECTLSQRDDNNNRVELLSESFESNTATAAKTSATRLCRRYIAESLTGETVKWHEWSAINEDAEDILTGRFGDYTEIMEDGRAVYFILDIMLYGVKTNDE